MLEVTRNVHIEHTGEDKVLTFKVRGTGRAIGAGRVICGSLVNTENVKHFVGLIGDEEEVFIPEGDFYQTINGAYSEFCGRLETKVRRFMEIKGA